MPPSTQKQTSPHAGEGKTEAKHLLSPGEGDRGELTSLLWRTITPCCHKYWAPVSSRGFLWQENPKTVQASYRDKLLFYFRLFSAVPVTLALMWFTSGTSGRVVERRLEEMWLFTLIYCSVAAVMSRPIIYITQLLCRRSTYIFFISSTLGQLWWGTQRKHGPVWCGSVATDKQPRCHISALRLLCSLQPLHSSCVPSFNLHSHAKVVCVLRVPFPFHLLSAFRHIFATSWAFAVDIGFCCL